MAFRAFGRVRGRVSEGELTRTLARTLALTLTRLPSGPSTATARARSTRRRSPYLPLSRPISPYLPLSPGRIQCSGTRGSSRCVPSRASAPRRSQRTPHAYSPSRTSRRAALRSASYPVLALLRQRGAHGSDLGLAYKCQRRPASARAWAPASHLSGGAVHLLRAGRGQRARLQPERAPRRAEAARLHAAGCHPLARPPILALRCGRAGSPLPE